MEKKHEMMSLEDSEQLKGRMKFFEKELVENHHIDPNLYVEYDVKRGLRDSAGKGVLTGLTEISDVTGYKLVNGRRIPADGALYYRGIDVQDIVNGLKDRRFGFEETIYLLIFGKLPSKEELSRFLELLSDMEDLGGRFVRDVVMKGTNANIMNAMERCVLALYTYDDNPEDISVENVLRQSLELIAKLPEIAVYSYHAYRHFRKDETLFIRNPQKGLSLAENILLMLRPDGNYTELEAKVLDIALVLHAEHGGGNNSTFTTHVVTSSGTDSYSSTSASIGSLKGPRHGGANLKVQNMFTDLKANVKDWESDEEITAYLQKILNKETPKGILGLSENSYMGIMNFVLLIPTWGWIISIIAWIVGKDKSEAVSTQGKYIFNWLISWSIYTLIIGLIFAGQFIGGIIGAIASPLSLLSGSLFNIGTLPFVLLFILYFVFPIIGGVKGLDGKLWKYPLSIPFLK